MPPFQARFSITGTSGDAFDDQPNDLRYFAGVATPAGEKNGTITLSISIVDGFSLNGGPWGAPPPGFLADGSTLAFNTVLGNCAATASIGTISKLVVNSALFTNSPITLEFNRFTGPGGSGSMPQHPSANITFPSTLLGAVDLITAVVCDLQLRWIFASSGAAETSVQKLPRIQGTYIIASFQWDLSPISGSAVEPGDTITITSDPLDPDALDFTELSIVLDDGVTPVPITPVTQTTNELTFLVPSGIVGEYTIYAVGNGTQFSGSITIGALEIFIADASGIYRIVTDKRNDTIYTHVGDETIDVAIPNPFIKSGFVGS